MKIAIQCDLHVELLGAQRAFSYLKNNGFDTVSYTFRVRYDQPFTTEWGEDELKQAYLPIGQAARDNGVRLLYTVIGTPCELYNSALPDTFEARKKMLYQAIRATEILGAEYICLVPPVMVTDPVHAYERSKDIFYQLADFCQEQLKGRNLKLAFLNNRFYRGGYTYGCSAEDMIQILDRYQAKLVYDPCREVTAGQREGDMLQKAGDRVLAMVMSNSSTANAVPTFPFLGSMDQIDYKNLKKQMRTFSDKVYCVCPTSDIYNQYSYLMNEELLTSLDNLMLEMAKEFTGHSAERGE